MFRRTIAKTQPHDFGRMAIEKASLVKVIIFGNNYRNYTAINGPRYQ